MAQDSVSHDVTHLTNNEILTKQLLTFQLLA